MRRTGVVGMIACVALLVAPALAVSARPAGAQPPAARAAAVTGRVTDASTGRGMPGVTMTVEGTEARALSDSAGVYLLRAVPAGPRMLRAQRLGFSPSRVSVVVPTAGTVTRDVQLARHALQLEGVRVTADPVSRARGELGTASVIGEEAIRNQTAASLAGVLELVPGVPLQAPGLDNVQQISLRTVPISAGGATVGRSAQSLAAFGTLIVLDGVPLSNNANLQQLASQTGLSFGSAAGGGVDLRRIPAATIERVEVIRGVPSARFGDLTNGAIIVDTRAGAVEPAFALRMDASSLEGSAVGGRLVGDRQSVTLTSNVARTRSRGGARDDQSTRVAGQLAHRLVLGGEPPSSGELAGADSRLVLDSRLDAFQLTDDRPEIATLPGQASLARDAGVRLQERLRLRLAGDSRLELTLAYERGRQRARSRSNMVRGAVPVTDRTEPGMQVGRYVGGIYNAAVTVEGDPSFLYSRLELSRAADLAGFSHDLRLGTELRREGNEGSGVQFDIEFPPQTRFDGVHGFERPRAFDEVPAIATSALYLDDRLARPLPNGMLLALQLGARLDVLSDGGSWLSGARDVALQPRANAELAVNDRLRFRAGAGRLAKSPSLGDLHPAPDYYDLINVNHFANEPAERLAVLTTFVVDPSNTDLGYSVADRVEAGVEASIGGANLGFTVFADRLAGGVGVRPEVSSVAREHFDLRNDVPGSGHPPEIVLPAASVDQVPILISRAANNLTQRGSGLEFTADLPEIPALRTRLAFQGALVHSRLEKDGIEFASNFSDFQLSRTRTRSPYYESIVRTGDRFLVNTRIIHQQPSVGLVVTGTIQHTLIDRSHNVGATDTVAFVGYVTRDGSLVPVPAERRFDPGFADLRIQRADVLANIQEAAVDWIFNLQVSKTLPRGGRLSFYAFNALDRTGRYGSRDVAARPYASTRFGTEVTMPLEGLLPWR
jgi:hypothetical protein